MMDRRFKLFSLRLRLTLLFLAGALVVWLVAGLWSWLESRDRMDEFFDTYQLLLAHQLVAADWRHFQPQGESRVVNPLERLEADGGREGDADDDALGFAVFDQAGRLIFSDGDHGRRFRYDARARGFVNQKIAGGQAWRLVWVASPEARVTVAVGQELDYRRDASLDLAGRVLWPWLTGLAVLSAAAVWLVGRELKPLRTLSGQLGRRPPDDLTPLETDGLPPEVAPLGSALNGLFSRLAALLTRERAFVADAAHELRTPLAALKVQAEVAQLAGDDPPVRDAALDKLILGIDRAARLVEQLLTLSRLDGPAGLGSPVPVDLAALVGEVVGRSALPNGEAAPVTVRQDGAPLLKTGHPALLSLMVGNLVDNARRYGLAEGGAVDIRLDGPNLTVTNRADLPDQYFRRLGERFFRPPGQEPGGSGLGLSIVRRVAELHGGRVVFRKTPPDLFSVIVTLPGDSGRRLSKA